MTNLYEVTEKLSAIKQMIASEQVARPELAETPDGTAPVYWPNTIHGKSGMFSEAAYQKMIESTPDGKDPVPSVA
jgi:hypothetical protein